jgi:predicted glutamine amidotransferase
MCLLTFMNEYTTASVEDLTVGADNNPDGFGFAVHAGTKIIHNSGLNFDKVLEEFLSVRAKHSGPALFHSRITTHGGTTVENCHPFQVGKDELTIVAHNGMLPIKEREGKSDTRIFAEEMLPQMGGASILNSSKRRKKLAKFAQGSKLVFLSANHAVNENYHIINENDGHWHNGVWWSNNSYKYTRHVYSHSGSSMYSSGWSKTYAPKKYDYSEPLYLPSDYQSNQFVEDCTYLDEDGNEVWGELWTCALCKHEEYFHEDNIDQADLCPICDGCWFCHNPRLSCECYSSQADSYSHLHSVGNYDSVLDQHF